MDEPEAKKAVKTQTFHEVSWPHPIFGEMGKSSERLHRFGDRIIIEFDDFDGEDQRTYTYQGQITLDEYCKALKEAMEKGESTIEKGENPPMNGWTWVFRYDAKSQKITMIFEGCGGCTPGGAMVYSTRRMSVKIDDLALSEDEGGYQNGRRF